MPAHRLLRPPSVAAVVPPASTSAVLQARPWWACGDARPGGWIRFKSYAPPSTRTASPRAPEPGTRLPLEVVAGMHSATMRNIGKPIGAGAELDLATNYPINFQ